MKLKTLKDLKIGMFSRATIKQETIKWVKSLTSECNSPGEEAILEKWKEFHNITEEDLE